ncbi:hypothetical protein [Paractinoplanes rishiriensis]|uniref:hypothetical protein n=1 Tax=Paractinoplanes rishiriensis TaxID=1050105 RepID=UPI001940BB5E|nr:hypothetical protein [Actinoplanes rishiriensis]
MPMFGCRAQHRAAVGHIRTAGEIVPTKKWAVFYYAPPSGSHFAISTCDLLESSGCITDHTLPALREPQIASVPDFGS